MVNKIKISVSILTEIDEVMIKNHINKSSLVNDLLLEYFNKNKDKYDFNRKD